MYPGDARPLDRVTAEELIRSYEVARTAHGTVHGDSTMAEYSPAEAAGALLEEHGLDIALLLARARVDYRPPSWEYEFQTWQFLESARLNAVAEAAHELAARTNATAA